MIYRVLPQNLATNSLMCHHQGRNCSGTAEGTLESELHMFYDLICSKRFTEILSPTLGLSTAM